jgi:hypothetical protein
MEECWTVAGMKQFRRKSGKNIEIIKKRFLFQMLFYGSCQYNFELVDKAFNNLFALATFAKMCFGILVLVSFQIFKQRQEFIAGNFIAIIAGDIYGLVKQLLNSDKSRFFGPYFS